MRDYGIVSPRFWIGDTGKQLHGDPVTQLIALYLITSPHAAMTGIYYCPMEYLSHETGTPLRSARRAISRLTELGFCEYDVATETVFVFRMAALQIAESLKPEDKRVAGLKKETAKIVPDSFKRRFLSIYGRLFHLVPEGCDPGPMEAPSMSLPSQDHDHDHDHDQNKRPAAAAFFDGISGRKAKPPSFDPAVVPGLNLAAWAMWVEYRAERKPAIKPVSMRDAAEELAAFGSEQFAVVKKAKASGWQGLYAVGQPSRFPQRIAPPNHDASWADAKSRAKTIGFREPYPSESADVYMTEVKLAERPARRPASAEIKALSEKLRVGNGQ